MAEFTFGDRVRFAEDSFFHAEGYTHAGKIREWLPPHLPVVEITHPDPASGRARGARVIARLGIEHID